MVKNALSVSPAPYVKVYLLDNGAYVAKKKTKIARKTLDPLYQQALLFDESPQGKVLQVSDPVGCWIWAPVCHFAGCLMHSVLLTGDSLG